MDPVLTMALVWLGAYLIGAIPFGYLVGRWRGVDIFKAGSGNIGATNVGRILGKKFGILVFVLDFAKGALPVIAALKIKTQLGAGEWLGGEMLDRGWLEVGAGLAAFLGHLFPVYLRFRGGKGVATGAGVVLVLLPGPTLAGVLTWATVVSATRYVSLASVAAALVLCGWHLATAGGVNLGEPRTLFCLFAVALVTFRHRTNIVRLLQGTEHHIQEGNSMRQLGKTLHVLALGLWFGSAVFFSFVVAVSLFNTFETLGKKPPDDRPHWFPLPSAYAKIDVDMQGPKEQGTRAAGYAVGPLFHWYFLLQGVCGFIAAGTALGWSVNHPGAKVHKWRTILLVLALATVLIGWPLERKVADLREPRNKATDAFLQNDPSQKTLDDMKAARGEFGRWHVVSLFLNFGTVILVTAAMALTAKLPGDDHQKSPESP